MKWILNASEAGELLDKFLGAPDRLGSRSKAARARASGKVFVNGAEAGAAEGRLRLKAGDEVRVWADRPGSAKRRAIPFTAGPLRILYEDPELIVIDKPAGLLAVPLERRGEETSAADQIERHMRSHGKRRPLVVHRIDRDTSGVVLFAKNARTQLALKQQFRARTPERVYLAVVYGHPDPAGRYLAGSSGVGFESADPEADASARSQGGRGDQRLSRRRTLRRGESCRDALDDRKTESDTDSSAPARPHAGGRGALHVRPRRAAPDPVRTSGPSRAATWVRPSRRWQAPHARGARARRHEEAHQGIAAIKALSGRRVPARLLHVPPGSPFERDRASQSEPSMKRMYKPNISATGRFVSAVAGATLATVGYRKSSRLLGALGLGLIGRGASGWCPVTAAMGHSGRRAEDATPAPPLGRSRRVRRGRHHHPSADR